MENSWSFWEIFDAGVFLILVTSSLGAIVVDYGLHTYITLKTQLILVSIAGVIAFAFYKKLKIPKTVAISLIIAVALIPYVQFAIGKMDLYVVDPPELRASVTATEIRIKMGTFYMTNTKGKEIAVMKDLPEKTLYPGGNEVHLGTINMPPGTYTGGRMKLERIEVDLTVDLEKEIELAMATAAKMAPNEASTDEIREFIRKEITSTFSEQNLNQMSPQGMQFKNIRNDGKKAYFTASMDVPEIQLPFPGQIPYPTGTGGPDITLDIILNSQGYPTNVKPIIHLPPGAPQIEMPDLTSELIPGISGFSVLQPTDEMMQRMQRESRTEPSEVEIKQETKKAVVFQGAVKESTPTETPSGGEVKKITPKKNPSGGSSKKSTQKEPPHGWKEGECHKCSS